MTNGQFCTVLCIVHIIGVVFAWDKYTIIFNKCTNQYTIMYYFGAIKDLLRGVNMNSVRQNYQVETDLSSALRSSC